MVDMYQKQYRCTYGVRWASSRCSSPTFEMGPLFQTHIYLAWEASVASTLPSVSFFGHHTTF